jgi:hypothetical protein
LKKVKSTAPSSGTDGYYGLLVGSMYGRIEGCTLTGCEISSASALHYLGILAGSLRGLAVNCDVEGCSATGGNYLGTIGALLNGKVVNCRISEVKVSSPNKYGGFVCGAAKGSNGNSAIIRNCMIHKYEKSNTTKIIGIISGYTDGVDASSCYYYYQSNQNVLFAREVTTPIESYIYSYSDNYRIHEGVSTTTPVVTLLNQWITQQEGTYEGIALFTWMYDSATSTLQLK